MIPWQHHWQQFTTQKHCYPNGVWLEIDAIPDLTGKPKAFLASFREAFEVERLCWEEGIVGIFCAIRHENRKIVRILEAAGMSGWREDLVFRYFYKHTIEKPEPLGFRDFHRLLKTGALHGNDEREPTQTL